MRVASDRLWIAALGVALLVACAEPPAATSEEAPPAPATPQAIAILEPPRIEIGETAVLEIAVSVPTGSRVAALPVPDETPGLWVLSAEGPTLESHPGRDVHRTWFRVRARETGSFAWPGGEILAFAPDGTKLQLLLEPRPFRVDSVLGDLPEQRSFFSYREPEAPSNAFDSRSLWLAGVAGALLALGGVALVGFVRRVRAAQRAPAAPSPGEAPWRSAQATLAAATEIAATDPVRAADMASAALRIYVDRRFRANTVTATTEELRETEPPFLLTTRWERLVDLLGRLDELRFPPASDASARQQRLLAVVGEAQAFIEDATPRGNLPTETRG